MTTLSPSTRDFLATWASADCEALTGDASTRRYFRLRKGRRTAILMDASQNRESLAPFAFIDEHLLRLGLSAPAIYASDAEKGLMLLEDFGDDSFTRLLENKTNAESLYTLASDVLIALHKIPGAIPKGLRAYHPAKMLEDIELFLEWGTPGISEEGKTNFRQVWGEVLPRAHHVPASLLLRDYHVGNLMRVPRRQGIRQVGLLDFQDAYQGPITYDLISLLEDARRDIPEELKEKILRRYLENFPALDQKRFRISMAILAALRHTRVLAIFERLSRFEGKHEYKNLHSPRVERLLKKALEHPELSEVKHWFEQYAF